MSWVQILVMTDFSKPFMVKIDASGFGLEVALLQNQRLVTYFSRSLGPRARLISIYEKELMAIAFTLGKYSLYLLGRHFVVKTNQQSLKFLLEQRIMSTDYQEWVSKLMGYILTSNIGYELAIK